VAFKVSAHRHADALYRGLQEKGVTNPLATVLDEYESVFLPVRDGASPAFDELVAKNGGLKKTVAKLCPERSTDVVTFFGQFYDALLDRVYSEQQNGASK